MNKSLRYDTLTAFDPVSQVATAGLIIVTRPDFPANNVKELVAAAKADPGKLSFASPGFGATQHFTGELFRQTAGIKVLHVPFRTSPEAIVGGARQAGRRAVRHRLGGAGPGAVRPAQGARGHRQGPVSRRCRTCRRRSNPAWFPATTPPPGTASSCRAARRPRSSPSSTRRSTRSSRRRRCASG